jgi:hypothetical protein
MKSFNHNFVAGYNKIRKQVDNSHLFRKAGNTLRQVNDYALPGLAIATAVNPALAPLTGPLGGILKGSQVLTENLAKNTKKKPKVVIA